MPLFRRWDRAAGLSGWTTRYDLAFELALGLADCTYLSSRFDQAEKLVAELLQRASSIIDKAAAYRLRINLHVVKSEIGRLWIARSSACVYLGIDMPAHPSGDEVRAEHRKMWRNLGDRQIEKPDRSAQDEFSGSFAPPCGC